MEVFGHGIRGSFTSKQAVRLILIITLGCIGLSPFGCSQSENHPTGQVGTPIVRVLIVENKPGAKLSALEPPLVRTSSGQSQRIGLSSGASATIRLTADGWQFGGVLLPPGVLTIEPAGEGSVSIDDHAYRGQFRFIPRAGGKFDVVNDVDVERYLMGVVALEMLPHWHEQAYQAQAIVARTYAIYQARTSNVGANYDLFADTRSQMYGGIAGETAMSRQAVEATRGMVVAYGPAGQERIFKAYFSSCCGGVTQSAAAAFGDPPTPPLSAQSTGNCCAISPHFNWPTVTISKSEITRRLRIWGANNNAPERTIGDVARIDILTTNRFGRPESFAVTDVRGLRYRMGSEDLRLGINTDATDKVRLPSSFCRPVNDASAIRFTEGHGFGHGAGLCQWCAQTQATAGVPHTQIVLKAFPGAVVVAAY